MSNNITYVGLDVHKNSIAIALAETDGNQEVYNFGAIGGDMASLDKTIRKLQSKGNELHFVYEAGPCGYEIYRHLTRQGFKCSVIAPSKTPKISGNRIKNDARDARTLARLARSGDLTSIYVPLEEDEAMRDLIRGREDAVKALRVARQVLGAFLLRHGFRYPASKLWGTSHTRWLSEIKMNSPFQQITLQEYINSVRECHERLNRLTTQIKELLPQWRMEPVVRSLQALRGVALIVASTFVAEIGDINRFKNPRQLMNYLGLVPSEHSSGENIKRGRITKTGNIHVRRVLVEASHSYCLFARVSNIMMKRQTELPKTVIEIAWKAQVRLCGRFRKLMKRGKSGAKVIIAIARELAGFMWAIAREVQPTHS